MYAAANVVCKAIWRKQKHYVFGSCKHGVERCVPVSQMHFLQLQWAASLHAAFCQIEDSCVV